MEARNQKARAMAQDFLLNETQYRLGFLEAEQSNPKTRSLGQTFLADPAKGVEMILSVDRDLVDVYAGILRGEAFARFCKLVADTLGRGIGSSFPAAAPQDGCASGWKPAGRGR